MDETLGLSPKPPETVIPATDDALHTALKAACESEHLLTIEKLVSDNPRDLFCWAALASQPASPIAQYAYARIGYHRGLDTLRANGWRGSGYVSASEASNRGFLTCLALLHHYAGVINETDEEERCLEFLQQLDPRFAWNSFPYENPIDFLFNK